MPPAARSKALRANEERMVMPREFESVINSASVRDDYIPKNDYLSPEFARYEAEHLWPRIWPVACRDEEIPNVGDFVTFDVLKDSLTIVRTAPATIKCFHNVCMHRGRRLTEGCGQKIGRASCRERG